MAKLRAETALIDRTKFDKEMKQGVKAVVKERLQALFVDAYQGKLHELVATKETGGCPREEVDGARELMNTWMLELSPALLEDFRLA